LKISHFVILSVVLSISLHSAYGQDDSESNVLLNFDFVNPMEKNIQKYVDYKITVSKDGVDVFGPSPLTHSSTGEVSIPLMLTEGKDYDVLIEVHRILFNSIPIASTTFGITTPSENIQTHSTNRNTLKISLAINKDPSAESKVIPKWVKNNVDWWAQGLISDDDFVKGIQYLIKEQIIDIPKLPYPSPWMDNNIPSWVKNNASWWADDLIHEDEFIKGIKYLAEKGIIQV
jgi:hypothetical protein